MKNRLFFMLKCLLVTLIIFSSTIAYSSLCNQSYTYAEAIENESYSNWNLTFNKLEISVNPSTYHIKGSIYVNDITDSHNIFEPRLTYNKRAYILHMLNGLLGDEIFYQGIKN